MTTAALKCHWTGLSRRTLWTPCIQEASLPSQLCPPCPGCSDQLHWDAAQTPEAQCAWQDPEWNIWGDREGKRFQILHGKSKQTSIQNEAASAYFINTPECRHRVHIYALAPRCGPTVPTPSRALSKRSLQTQGHPQEHGHDSPLRSSYP